MSPLPWLVTVQLTRHRRPARPVGARLAADTTRFGGLGGDLDAARRAPKLFVLFSSKTASPLSVSTRT